MGAHSVFRVNHHWNNRIEVMLTTNLFGPSMYRPNSVGGFGAFHVGDRTEDDVVGQFYASEL